MAQVGLRLRLAAAGVAIATTLALSGCSHASSPGDAISKSATPGVTQKPVEKVDATVFDMPLGSSAEQLAEKLTALKTARFGGRSAFTFAQARAFEDPQYLNTSKEDYSADEAKRELTAISDDQFIEGWDTVLALNELYVFDEQQFADRFVDLITTDQNAPDKILDDHFALYGGRPILQPQIISGDTSSDSGQVVIRYFIVEENDVERQQHWRSEPESSRLERGRDADHHHTGAFIPRKRYRIAGEQSLSVDP